MFIAFTCRFVKSVSLALLAVVSSCAVAQADEPWEFRLTPYVWVPYIDGNFAVGSDQPSSTSTSIFDYLDGGILLQGEVRKGDWALLGEFDYLSFSHSASSAQGRFGTEVTVDGYMATLALAKRIHETSRSSVDFFGGARHWRINLTTDFVNLQTRSASKIWTDPIFGLRGAYDITDDIFVTGLADIGGFDVGSKFQLELVARGAYRLTDSLNVALGYRYLDIDFDDSVLVLDASFYGPFLAVDLNF
jgi:opacity protein-like surface antigen